MPRRNRGTIYSPKTCQVCGDEYVPTSGRQLCCTKPACRAQLEQERRARKVQARRDEIKRPIEKQCEWPDCLIMFPLASTGVRPKFCPDHRRMHIAPKALEATAAWRNKTVDIECEHPHCENLQHPSGRGWCNFHYPILSMHGLDAAGWWVFYNAQGGNCPICDSPLFDGRVVVIDHDHVLAPQARHDVEHVRGLLHGVPCNSVIVGGIETAIANNWLDNAMRYIKFPPSESNR